MSYFVVVSGESADLVAPNGGRLVPMSDAQPYVSNLSAKIAAADGGPSYFWEDNETGTSSELVWAAENSILDDGSAEASALGRLLASCEAHGVTARVWWANDDSEAYLGVPNVLSATNALEVLRNQVGRGPGVGFVMHPNFSSKPTP